MDPADVNDKEKKIIESKGFANFSDPPNEDGTMWIRRKNDGSCFFLTKEKKCAIYDVRPAVCRLEPFTIVDFDYENGKIELDLSPAMVSICEGLNEGKVIGKEEIGKAAQKILEEFLELDAQAAGPSITDQRVASLTRRRIMGLAIMANKYQQGRVNTHV